MNYSEFAIDDRRGGSLFARSWLPDSTPTAIVGLVHGLGDHSGRCQGIADFLVNSNLAVVAYDQRGHGRSGGALPSFDTLMSDIDPVLARMQELSTAPPFLYGISLGGGLVLNYALKRKGPLRGVIASSPLLATAFQPPRWKLAFAKLLQDWWPSFTLPSGIDPNALSHDPEAVEQYRKDPLVHHRISAALGLSMLEAGRWAVAHASELAVPVLLMHGTQDRITSHIASQEFAEGAGPQCTLRLWDDLYHDLHHERTREEVLTYVTQWISIALARQVSSDY